jgi:dihydrofolate reductase
VIKRLTLIAAMGKNREIGLEGRMPWHLPAELKHFKEVTMGKSIVMGRKTWQAIGRPLPGRQNIVITRNTDFDVEGADVAGSLDTAIEMSVSDEVMVIGGGELYALALPLAQRMILTLIDIEPEADTWFPGWNAEHWQQTEERSFPVDDVNNLAYRIVEFRRIADETLSG